jgi:hypothetical protein
MDSTTSGKGVSDAIEISITIRKRVKAVITPMIHDFHSQYPTRTKSKPRAI